MISGFQGREFGLESCELLTPDKIEEINKLRKGKAYKSEEDAKLILYRTKKADLIDDLSLRYFKSGINRDGYWN